MAFFFGQKAANQHTERSQNAVNNSTHQRKTHEYTVLPLTSWSKVAPNLNLVQPLQRLFPHRIGTTRVVYEKHPPVVRRFAGTLAIG